MPLARTCTIDNVVHDRRLAGVEIARAEPLAHLLAVLDAAVRLMDEAGFNVDARVIEAHRAQLARGKEWPGDPISSVTFADGSSNG